MSERTASSANLRRGRQASTPRAQSAARTLCAKEDRRRFRVAAGRTGASTASQCKCARRCRGRPAGRDDVVGWESGVRRALAGAHPTGDAGSGGREQRPLRATPPHTHKPCAEGQRARRAHTKVSSIAAACASIVLSCGERPPARSIDSRASCARDLEMNHASLRAWRAGQRNAFQRRESASICGWRLLGWCVLLVGSGGGGARPLPEPREQRGQRDDLVVAEDVVKVLLTAPWAERAHKSRVRKNDALRSAHGWAAHLDILRLLRSAN
eukprot:97328-Prymnesium_polylepis.1